MELDLEKMAERLSLEIARVDWADDWSDDSPIERIEKMCLATLQEVELDAGIATQNKLCEQLNKAYAKAEQQAEQIRVAEELNKAAENLLKHIEIISYPRKGGLSTMRMLADRLAESNEEFQKARAADGK